MNNFFLILKEMKMEPVNAISETGCIGVVINGHKNGMNGNIRDE
jgi:hypothetical protein